jgi:hypothetical protein
LSRTEGANAMSSNQLSLLKRAPAFIKDFRSGSSLSRQALEKTRIYKFAGKIYHRGYLATKVRLKFRTRYLIKRLDSRNVAKTILFYPDKPDCSQVLYKICNNLGWVMTSSIKSHPDLIVAFQDTTKRVDGPVLTKLAADNYVVNRGCDDISKVKVEDVFRDVFGYGTFVDPETYVGLCVVKSNANAMHDGEAIECPTTATRNDVVYQKVINNAIDDEVLDIRVPIVGSEIPFVYLKYRSLKSRFSNKNRNVTIGTVDSVFTQDEITTIKQFVEKLCLDFGELDVLRDAEDGKIYIVDVNNTPCGPPNGLSKAESARAVQILSSTFIAEFFARTP